MDPTNASYGNYKSWAFFKKKTQVPGNVVVALDVTARPQSSKDRFNAPSTLNGVGSSAMATGDDRHSGRSNVLFADGVVRRVRVLDYTATGGPASQIESWMVLAPTPIGDDDTMVWQKGRDLPNF